LRLANVATAPETLTLKEHRDSVRAVARHARHAGLLVLAAISVAALLNVFGQRPETSSAATAAARLQVYAPTHARSGNVYAARIRVDARRELKRATIVLDPGWAEQYTVNGAAPQPVSEGSADGKLEFVLGHIARGTHYTFFLSLQVNPTNVGRRSQDVRLLDGSRQLLVIRRSIMIWP
jgi:hypothetical protein